VNTKPFRQLGLGLMVYGFWFGIELLHRNVQRFRGGLVFKAHRLCISLNSRLESSTEEEEGLGSNLVLNREADVREVEINWYSSQFKNSHFTEMCCGYRGGLVSKAHRLLYHSA